jgi:hypothetical protein
MNSSRKQWPLVGGLAASLALLVAVACTSQPTGTVADTTPASLGASADSSAATNLLPRFPDFGFQNLPQPGDGTDKYTGRVFKLSQDYPRTKPALDPDVQKILAIDYRQDWQAYMLAVRAYIFDGNIGTDGVRPNDFYLEDNKKRRWFHVPWQHYGPHGREGVHGLTKEGPVYIKVLGPQQTEQWQTYAVGFYNEPGGYMIGKTWADANNPNLSVVQREGFPEGTVVGKILFTTAPVEQAPFLQNSVEWRAYTTATFATTSPRAMSTVRFVQMDIMVRDSRAKATGGWVFGTFAFNGKLPHPSKTAWLNTVPVGLMWGNDPTVRDTVTNSQPLRTRINPNLKETIINPSPDLPAAHLGYGLRLNGPVDNTRSSCMSCHSTAQFPAISPILPFLDSAGGKPLAPGSVAWMRWFRNVPCQRPFDKQAVSADYSLQLAASIQNFLMARSAATGGIYAVEYWHGRVIEPLLGMRGTTTTAQKVLTQGFHEAVREASQAEGTPHPSAQQRAAEAKTF